MRRVGVPFAGYSRGAPPQRGQSGARLTSKPVVGEAALSRFGRAIGLLVALLMFCFSAWMYTRTGDWVAALFALGSVAYGFFFYTSTAGK
jgi:hypothetical protein